MCSGADIEAILSNYVPLHNSRRFGYNIYQSWQREQSVEGRKKMSGKGG